MEERYHDLIDEISDEIAQRLFEDAEWLEEEHPFEIDELIFELMMLVGLAALEKVWNRLSDKKIEECRHKGMRISEEGEPVEMSSKLGTARVRSPYLRNRETGESARPMKDEFGVIGQGKTPALERALADFGSEDSYAQAEQRFEEHYGFNVGRTSILRVTNDVGEEALTYLDERLPCSSQAAEREDSSVEQLLAELDGCLIRTGEYMTAMRAGLAGREEYEPDDVVRVDEWKEVRVGFVRRLGEVSKKYVSRMGDYDEICEQLHGLALLEGWTPETKVISPGDGGNGLKEALEEQFPHLQFILDHPHLKSHFHETAEAIGIDEELQDQWVEEFLDAIWEGELEEVLERLRELYQQTDHNRLDRLIRHLERFSDSLNYEEYEAKGWPIGSGEVESAHQYLPQDRLKLPGACWNVDSINPMLAIRVIKKNGWWDDFWSWRIQRQQNAA